MIEHSPFYGAPAMSAPCQPLYPRVTVRYNYAIKAVEVGFYGPEVGVIHIITPDLALRLTHLLKDAGAEGVIHDVTANLLRQETLEDATAEEFRAVFADAFSKPEALAVDYEALARDLGFDQRFRTAEGA